MQLGSYEKLEIISKQHTLTSDDILYKNSLLLKVAIFVKKKKKTPVLMFGPIYESEIQ